MQTTSFITVRANSPLTEIKFCAWLAQAAPGDTLEYYRGFLMVDRIPRGRLPEGDRTELMRIARRALWAAEQGLVHLVQKRHGADDYSYVAIARPRPKADAGALLNLFAETANAVHGSSE